MFYNNVTLYRKAIFWLKTRVNNNKNTFKKAFKIKQTVSSTVQNTGYMYLSQPIFMVCIINSERNYNIHMLGFIPQSGNNKNA